MALLKVKIITPQEVVYDGTAQAITLPSEAGEMQVYQGHIPVLARIVKGTVRLESPNSAPQVFGVDEGFARITKDDVSLLIDNVERV